MSKKKYKRWNYKRLLASMSPEERRAHFRALRASRAISWLLRPMYRPILLVGSVFWGTLIEEILAWRTKPTHLWAAVSDAMIFAFLNDGMRPSLWHTWQQIIRTDDAGIYIGRAPKNRVEAEWVNRNHKNLPRERVDR